MKKHHSLFIGFKASRAIPIRDNLTRDFLVQSTLDGGVCRIDYQPGAPTDEGIIPRGTIILERFDGRFAIDIAVEARPAYDAATESLLDVAFARNCAGIIVVDAADILSEPHCSSAREVWSHRTVRVHGDDRAQILETLESEGPTKLARLEEMVVTRGDARATIYAMACEGTIELDLRSGLGRDAVALPGRFGGSMLQGAYGA
jgi:hypothetical protein